MIETLSFLLQAFLGGFLVLLTEELVASAVFSLPTLAVATVIGLVTRRLTRSAGRKVSWILTGSTMATSAAVLRLALVHGGPAVYVSGVDCFAMRDMTPLSYGLFALSGAAAGYAIGLREPQGHLSPVAGLAGIAVGVLYHLKVASGWWSAEVFKALPLGFGEFLAPAAFAVGCMVLVRPFTREAAIAGRKALFTSSDLAPFLTSALVGCALWSLTGGLVHAYVMAPDWSLLGPAGPRSLAGVAPVLSLMFVGAVYGLVVEVAKFLGAAIRSSAAVLAGPFIAGGFIGAMQGVWVATPDWGWNDGVLFRPAATRILAGLVTGLILAVPTVLVGVAIRGAHRRR